MSAELRQSRSLGWASDPLRTNRPIINGSLLASRRHFFHLDLNLKLPEHTSSLPESLKGVLHYQTLWVLFWIMNSLIHLIRYFLDWVSTSPSMKLQTFLQLEPGHSIQVQNNLSDHSLPLETFVTGICHTLWAAVNPTWIGTRSYRVCAKVTPSLVVQADQLL